jgi:hypothetical protein
VFAAEACILFHCHSEAPPGADVEDAVADPAKQEFAVNMVKEAKYVPRMVPSQFVCGMPVPRLWAFLIRAFGYENTFYLRRAASIRYIIGIPRPAARGSE